MTLETLLLIASGLMSTTYGHDELACGDVKTPRPCSIGAVTASGVPFDPSLPQVAIAAPERFILKHSVIGLRIKGGQCKSVNLVDKMHHRWIGERGFDLTPAAVRLITGKAPTEHWSGVLFVCVPEKTHVKSKDRPNLRPKSRKSSHANQVTDSFSWPILDVHRMCRIDLHS